jgi:predicted ATPase/DNA-binding CsgD family transcriptional regulator
MIPHNLPSQLTPFVGRTRELVEIADLLVNPDCRLLTLVGPGGVGKTRLALEAAQIAITAANDSGRYAPMGVYFVSLAPLVSPDFIVSTMAEAIGLQFYQGVELKQQFLNRLREQSLLLVLDNFEHVVDGAHIISEALAAAPGVKVLATSRERLNLHEEWVLEVNGLNVPLGDDLSSMETYSAVQLFVQNARRVDVSFALSEDNKSAVIQICRLVEGMPLAIELAATWVRALSCAEIAAEIEHGPDILETSARNVPERHRKMRCVLEQTWGLLTADEQNVFQQLSVFRGGFTREAAASVSGASLRMLSGLVDKSLLKRDADGRYRIHELLRQFAAEQLDLSSIEAAGAHDRHATYYAAFMGQQWELLRSTKQRQALDLIEGEIENVRAAWTYMVKQGQLTNLYQMANGLWYFHRLAYRIDDGYELFTLAEKGLQSMPDSAETAQTLGLITIHQASFCDNVDFQMLHETITRLRSLDAWECVMMGLNVLVHRRVGEHGMTVPNLLNDEIWVEAKQSAEAGYELAQQHGDTWGMAQMLYSQALVAFGRGENEEAWRLGTASLELAELTGDPSLVGSVAGPFLGRVTETLGAYDESKRLRHRSNAIWEANGYWIQIGWNYQGLGYIAYLEGDYIEAKRCYQRSLEIYLMMRGHPYRAEQITQALVNVGKLWAAFGHYEVAVALLSAVQYHAATDADICSWAAVDLAAIKPQLTPERFEVALGRGKALDLEAIAESFVHESAEAPTEDDVKPISLDNLTEREQQILGLVAAGKSNREIAEELVFSLGTVKWYVNQIYSKLHVNSRTQAVARGRELHLLA